MLSVELSLSFFFVSFLNLPCVYILFVTHERTNRTHGMGVILVTVLLPLVQPASKGDHRLQCKKGKTKNPLREVKRCFFFLNGLRPLSERFFVSELGCASS